MLSGTISPNLWNHLQSCHKALYTEAKKKEEDEKKRKAAAASSKPIQVNLQDSLESHKKWDNSHDRSREFDKLIIEMIVTDNDEW